jgi:SAM-dependent methyltransferase
VRLKQRLTAPTKHAVRTGLRRAGFDVSRVVPTRFLATDTPASSPLPQDLARLEELRSRYRSADPAVTSHTYWSSSRVAARTFVDTQGFRAESMYVWQYVDHVASVKVQRAEYQYFVYLQYLEAHGGLELLAHTAEDGAFGAPMFRFPGRPPVSRDVLDSVNEILYLDRQLGIRQRAGLRVLDIGAGYGRLAHRMTELVPGLVDYACIDAIPESTYVCERYLDVRGLRPTCRVVELPDAQKEIQPDRFDLAVNIHSFSEMSAAAIEYWIDLLAAAEVPALLVVPNAPTAIRSYEADGSRRDVLPVLAAAGFELDHVEPIITDPAARELFGVHDHFHLFRRTS